MPEDRDVELLNTFLQETVATFELVAERGDLKARERHALLAALREFAEKQPRLILDAYREKPDSELAAAGVLDQQLAAKVEIPQIFAELLRSEMDPGRLKTDGPVTERSRRPRTGNIRRWLKRARVLVGTLASILPPAEALSELLDLFDAALDRASPN
jgi:hypothetical protein